MSRNKKFNKPGLEGGRARQHFKAGKAAAKSPNNAQLNPIKDHAQKKDKKKVEENKSIEQGARHRKRPHEDTSSVDILAKKAKTMSGPLETIQPLGATASDAWNTSANTTTSPLSATAAAIPASLEKTHTVTTFSVISSTKITGRVTRILEALSTFSFTNTPPKPPVVQLIAKPGCAVKLISIVEIAKREIASQGQKWYQYTSVERKEMELKVKTAGKENQDFTAIAGETMATGINDEDTNMDEGTGDMDDTAFETMKTPLERAIEGRPKFRAVPFMTTYLSRTRVDSLKAALGYVFLPWFLTYIDKSTASKRMSFNKVLRGA